MLCYVLYICPERLHFINLKMNKLHCQTPGIWQCAHLHCAVLLRACQYQSAVFAITVQSSLWSLTVKWTGLYGGVVMDTLYEEGFSCGWVAGLALKRCGFNFCLCHRLCALGQMTGLWSCKHLTYVYFYSPVKWKACTCLQDQDLKLGASVSPPFLSSFVMHYFYLDYKFFGAESLSYNVQCLTQRCPNLSCSLWATLECKWRQQQ